MIPALIYAIVATLLIYFIIAICYFITIAICTMAKITTKDVRRSFVKFAIIAHTICFIPHVIFITLLDLHLYLAATIILIIFLLVCFFIVFRKKK